MSNKFVTGTNLADVVTAMNTTYNERFARKSDITTAYKPKGSLSAAELTASLLVDENVGNVYNLTSKLVITDSNKDLFVESLTAAEYVLTSDNVAVSGKTYYERTGTDPDFVYTEVDNIEAGVTDVSAYYELVENDTFSAGNNVVIIEVTPTSYVATSDTTAVEGKTYYSSNGLIPPTYTEVANVEAGVTNVSNFYEKVEATYKFDLLSGIVACEAVSQAEIQLIINSIQD